MSRWIEPEDVTVPTDLRAAVGGHPLVARTLVRRGFTSPDQALAFLDPDRYQPAPPSDLPNLIQAAERLERAIQEGERICVWGDFDVDGQTATTTLVSTLEDLGATVRYHIPHRKREGHGFHLPVLKRLLAEGIDLVLTCDTGVTAHETVAFAQAQGVDVIVTDHHDLPPTLPPAHAVVNPKMLPETHPLRQLPGVGCAYKLTQALYQRAGRAQEAAQFLDLVALGIVADVATQVDDTRYLLQRGLEALRQPHRLGLEVLMEVAELNPQWLTEEHIGFEIAPRLNALGRLADANVAVELLTTDDPGRARILATELEGLNAQRKLLCDQVTQAAEAQIERDPSLLEGGALVLSHPSWPASVVGIVAGRLAEKYHRPTILIAAPPEERGRGSARSIEGVDIHAAIAAQSDLLHRFGGHPMAAGLTIDPEHIPQFRRRLSRTVQRMLEEVEVEKTLQIDGYVPLADLDLDLVEQIERLAPYGPGNPLLTLISRGATIKSHTAVGRSDEHLQLLVEDEGETAQKVIWWRGADQALPQGEFDLAYTARASDFRGQRDIQVEWIDARPIEAPVTAPQPLAIEVIDYRNEPRPHQLLEHLRRKIKDLQVWSEAQHRKKTGGRDRHQLQPTEDLAIWTTPPGPTELEAILERVAPERVYLFAIDPGLDRPQEFLHRLAGLTKHALSSDDGRVRVSQLAAATAHREPTVWVGLAWLAARGHLALLAQDDDQVHIGAGNGVTQPDLPQVTARLKSLLEETAAYRTHFARSAKDTLIGPD